MENCNYRFRATQAVLEIRFEGEWPDIHYRLYVDNEPTEVTDIDPGIVQGAAWCGTVRHDFFRQAKNVEEIPHELELWESIPQ